MLAVASLRTTLTKSGPGPWVNNFARTTSGRIIALLTPANAQSDIETYKSDESGESWEPHTVITGPFDTNAGALLHLPDRILITGGGLITDISHGDLKIYKSTDNGLTWVEKASFAAQAAEVLQPLQIRGGMTFQREGIWLTGNCINEEDATEYYNFRSDDKGESWTPLGEIRAPLADRPYEMPRALEDGRWLMPTRRTFDSSIPDFTTLTVKIGTAYGAAWSASNPLPVPADAGTPAVATLCAFTSQIIVAGGHIDSALDPNYAPLWRSTDSGETWTHITGDKIAGFPTTGAPPEILAIRRLTADSAMLTWGPTQNDGETPIAISTDQGLNWYLNPTMEDIDLTAGTYAGARAATAEDGRIITALTRFAGDDNISQIISIRLC